MALSRFVIPGEPRGWRVQIAVRGGKPFTRLADNAQSWRDDAVMHIGIRWSSGGFRRPAIRPGPLVLHVQAVFTRPKRMDCGHTRKPCSCPPEKLDGRSLPHTSTPDMTNILKLAEDSLKLAGVIDDDRWVCRQSTNKRYAEINEEPHVEILLGLLSEEG